MVVGAPALEAPVVLRSTSSLMHPEAGAECLQGVSQGSASLPQHHSCPSPLPLSILPATHRCDGRQRRSRPRMSPAPGRPQGGSPPSLHPHTRLSHHPLTTSTSVATNPPSITRKGPSRSVTTVDLVAALEFVAVPELPIVGGPAFPVVSAPALDAPGVLLSAASLMHPEAGAGCLQGVFQGPIDSRTCQQQCSRRISLTTATHTPSLLQTYFRFRQQTALQDQREA